MKTGKIIRKISLRRKIFQYLLWTNFISIILLGLFWIQGRVTDYRKEIRNLKESFSENKKSEIRSNILQLKDWIYWIRNHPDDALSRATPRYLLNNSDPDSMERFLQEYCLDSLSRTRYSADEYVFVNTFDGKALISNGKINTPPVDIFNAGDTSWIRIFKAEQLAKTKPGGLFYNYSFRKISSSKYSLKTSYISHFPEWDWIIGTGYYEDDINPLIKLKKEELIVSMRKSLIKVAPLIFITILFSIGIVLLFSRRMAKNVEIFKDFFAKAAIDKISIDKSRVSYKEFDILAETANHMVEESIKAEVELKLHRDHLEELVIQRTEELEVEKEHAQSADRLKSAFLATMSHELRTPLNSIIGFSGILMQELPGQLNEEQKKQLGMAQNSARHLLSLVNDVLDISKIEAGQLKMNIHQFNLPELINKVVESNKPFANKKNLRILVFIDEKIKDIRSDNLRVQQILLNLVNNAIKFTDTGTINISCFKEEEYIKIKIADSGMGIEKEKIDQLFKPFMQVDTGLTRKHEGTGLGLSICKKLTEMLKGKIEVESIYGSGSTFTISLPII